MGECCHSQCFPVKPVTVFAGDVQRELAPGVTVHALLVDLLPQKCGISEDIFQSRMKLLPSSTQTNNVNKEMSAVVPSLLSNATFPIMLR